ncbi:MAG: hypothetical protein ABI355_15670, partial [Solirubrobacteraceae bacterium]
GGRRQPEVSISASARRPQAGGTAVMTPAALTPAAREATPRRKPSPESARPAPEPRRAAAGGAGGAPRAGGASRTSSARNAGHRGPVRASAAPRRVSGPATGAPRSRRVSGPVRGAAGTQPVTRRPAGRPIALPRPGLLAARISAVARSLPDHRLLDRVVRGRSWIPILGLLLTGIVAMQVETLRLSASTGRSLERVTALQSRNQQLLDNVAVLADDQRIERLAAGLSMVMPGPTQIRFLAAHGGSVSQAAGGIHTPNATAFLAGLPSAAGPAAPVGAGTAASVPTTGAAAPVTPAAAAPAVVASAPAPGAPSTAATAAGVPSSSAAPASTAPSGTNTGVASTGANAASPPASSGAPGPVTPAAPSVSTPDGAAGVTAGG